MTRALVGDRIRVSRSLYMNALSDAIVWKRGALATHDPIFEGASSCCTSNNRCDGYKQTALLLARYERAEGALLGRGRVGGDATSQAAAQVPEGDAVSAASVFRCAECDDGSRLFGWVHLIAYGPVGVDGVVARYDWTEDDNDIIQESIICEIHGDGGVEKLIDDQYTSTMVNGRYVPASAEENR